MSAAQQNKFLWAGIIVILLGTFYLYKKGIIKDK